MKKVAALILLGLMIFSLTPVVHTVKSAEIPPYATISAISLKRGDKAIIGNFEVEFADANYDWTQVYIRIKGPDKSVGGTVRRDEYVAYPSKTDVYLRAMVTYIDKYKQSIYISIQSPLIKIISNKTLSEGGVLKLPSEYQSIPIKLLDSDGAEATFQITMPDKTRVFTLEEGKGVGLGYPLGGEFIYSNYIYIELIDSKSNGKASFNVYAPKVSSTNFRIVQKEEPENQENPTETVLLYNGLLYINEELPVDINNKTYYIKLVSTIPNTVLVEVLKGTQKIDELRLVVGDVPKNVEGIPLKLSVQSVEPEYKRATIRVYGPENAEVTPILRNANIIAKISAIPEKIMIEDNLVLTINVQNLGRGDAYDVSVAAPIPNDFELVSMTKSWVLKNFPAFTNMPALIYVLKPKKVGKFDIGRVTVTFYDDKSLETGKKKTVYSLPLTGIEVYGIPEIKVSAMAYNGSWSNYVTAGKGDKIKVKFKVSAIGDSPEYEFVNNATLLIGLPKGLKGSEHVSLGTIKANETKEVQVEFTVSKEALMNVEASLMYLDPLGNEHRLDLGNLVTINSIPPKVVVEEVKVWPTPEELPGYVNQTLAKMSDPTPLAEELKGIAEAYSPRSNPWKPAAVIFLLMAVVLGALTYRYYSEAEKLRRRLERKKQRRPGGLPKKAEETEGSETIEL